MPVLSIETRHSISNESSHGYTDEMITDSAELDFIFELFMTKNFAANSVQSWIDDFCHLDFLVCFHTCNTFWETFHKFLRIIVENWSEYFNCWQ
jgi:hypothetical protein